MFGPHSTECRMGIQDEEVDGWVDLDIAFGGCEAVPTCEKGTSEGLIELRR